MQLYEEILNKFPIIEKRFSADELLEFKDTLAGDLYMYHFGLGIWIRNNLLKEKSLLYQLFIENNIIHKDEMSFLTIKLFHFSLSVK